jgi:hypothetical protein
MFSNLLPLPSPTLPLHRKPCRLWNNMEKCGGAGQATDGSITRHMHIACWVNKATETQSEYVIVNCFSTSTMVERKRRNIALFARCRHVLLIRTSTIYQERHKLQRWPIVYKHDIIPVSTNSAILFTVQKRSHSCQYTQCNTVHCTKTLSFLSVHTVLYCSLYNNPRIPLRTHRAILFRLYNRSHSSQYTQCNTVHCIKTLSFLSVHTVQYCSLYKNALIPVSTHSAILFTV